MTLAQNYDVVAAEYYDAQLHPTCANFRSASSCLIERFLQRVPTDGRRVVEFGAGRSVVAEILLRQCVGLETLTLIDQSVAMLEYSRRFEEFGAKLIVSAAEQLPLEAGSVDVGVACLGDPYNASAFWSEVFRVLRPGGLMYYTTPSYEWSSAFRVGSDDMYVAEFRLRDSSIAYMPSIVVGRESQTAMIESSRLKIAEYNAVRLDELNDINISPKLLIDGRTNLEIVSGYLSVKPHG